MLSAPTALKRNQTGRRCRFGLAALLLLAWIVPAVAASEDNESAVIGYTEPFRTVKVSAGEPGVIAELLVKEGAIVKEGQVLARLETNVTNSELEIAEAQVKQQETHLKRLEEMNKTSRVTPEELDRARTDLVIRNAEVKKYKAIIETRTMRSPVNGVVTDIKRDVAESVSASSPHVLTVVQIDKLNLNLYLSPKIARPLKLGAEARIRFVDDGVDAPARVDFVSPVTDSASGTVRVKFVIDNATGQYRGGVSCTLAP